VLPKYYFGNPDLSVGTRLITLSRNGVPVAEKKTGTPQKMNRNGVPVAKRRTGTPFRSISNPGREGRGGRKGRGGEGGREGGEGGSTPFSTPQR
jgi:hypothetical protein